MTPSVAFVTKQVYWSMFSPHVLHHWQMEDTDGDMTPFLESWLTGSRQKEKRSRRVPAKHGQVSFIKAGETTTRGGKQQASILDGTTIYGGWPRDKTCLSRHCPDYPKTRYCTLVKDLEEAHCHWTHSAMGNSVRRLMSGRGWSTPSSWNFVENRAGVLGCSPWKLALEGFALSLYIDLWQQLEQLAGAEGRLSGNWAKLRNVRPADCG